MLLNEDANAIFSFMMQMSHVGIKMPSLFMTMLVHAFKLWCKCLITKMEKRMSSNGYVMMQMFWYKCPFWVYNDASALLWVCRDVNVPMVHVMMRMTAWEYVMAWMSSYRYAMNANAPLWVYHATNALMQTQFIQKFPLFSKRGFLNTWNQNIFKLNLSFLKSHLLFDLRLPKKLVITVRNLRKGH